MGSLEDPLEIQSSTIGQEAPEELARRLNLPFRDWLLLSRALTHRSYLNEHPEALEDNERLEFLGDAVLDFIVGAWLYNRYPEMPEGRLTRMRSCLVETGKLAEFATTLDLNRAMRLGKGELQGNGLRATLLCDTFEALVGALFLDSGIEVVKNFLNPLLSEAADDILQNHKTEDPKSLFQEWAQAQGFSTPIYITRNSSGPDHSKIFEVDVMVKDQIYGNGTGHSKQAATKTAAQDALNRLGIS
jgi:ribonuclease III